MNKQLRTFLSIEKQKSVGRLADRCYKKGMEIQLARSLYNFPEMPNSRISNLIDSGLEPYIITYLDTLKHISKENRRKLYDYCNKMPIIETFNQIDRQLDL